jgi:hypothetical protein
VNIPADKQLHFFSAWALTLTLAQFMGIGPAALLAFVIGMAKEVIWDGLMRRGSPDIFDMVANAGGIAMALIAVDAAQRFGGLQ